MLSFSWDRFGSRGVVAALVTGLITTIVWIATGFDQKVTAMVVTFFVSIGTAVLATLIERRDPGRASA
jgi:sodium/proline symporter